MGLNDLYFYLNISKSLKFGGLFPMDLNKSIGIWPPFKRLTLKRD